MGAVEWSCSPVGVDVERRLVGRVLRVLRVRRGRGRGQRRGVRGVRVRVRVSVRVRVRVPERRVRGLRAREALGAPALAAHLLLATPLRATIREPHLKVESG